MRKGSDINNQPIPVDVLIAGIECTSKLWEYADPKFRNNSLRKKYNEALSELISLLQKRNDKIDVEGMFWHLHLLQKQKTFPDLQTAQQVLQQLKDFNIEIPEFIVSASQEIEKRTRIINEYVSAKHHWTDKQRQDWQESIDVKLQARTTNNPKFKKEYLNKLIYNVVEKIEDIEKQALEKYGYYIESFYKGDQFVATGDDLNSFYFHAEIKAGGYAEISNVFLLMKRYIDHHNEISLLKERLGGSKSKSINNLEETYIETLLDNLKLRSPKNKGVLYLLAECLKQWQPAFANYTVSYLKIVLGNITKLDLNYTTEATAGTRKKYTPIISNYIKEHIQLT